MSDLNPDHIKLDQKHKELVAGGDAKAITLDAELQKAAQNYMDAVDRVRNNASWHLAEEFGKLLDG